MVRVRYDTLKHISTHLELQNHFSLGKTLDFNVENVFYNFYSYSVI